jgi:hypothetical protein
MYNIYMNTLNEIINQKFTELDALIEEIEGFIKKDGYAIAWSLIENSNKMMYEIKKMIEMIKLPSQVKVKEERLESKKNKLIEIVRIFRRSDYFNDID